MTCLEHTPKEFICPITEELMKNPVKTVNGYSYEREAIEKWFAMGHFTSPLTGEDLPSTDLVPNQTLKKLIIQYNEESIAPSTPFQQVVNMSVIDGKYTGSVNASNQRHGLGVHKWVHGDQYDGEWQDDKKHGLGVWKGARGDQYYGEWKNDNMHGQATLSRQVLDLSIIGCTYTGSVNASNQQHGLGVCKFANGDQYDGQWKNGLYYGHDSPSSADGTKYRNKWDNGTEYTMSRRIHSKLVKQF